MSGWINLATTFPRHPKALAAGPVARHLFIVGLCWAGEYDTDGVIPGYALNSLAIDAGIAQDDIGQTADRLVEVGLWKRCADGWQVHDWGQWQSTSAEREERRSKNRERQRNWRERQAAKAAEEAADRNGVTDASPTSDIDTAAPVMTYAFATDEQDASEDTESHPHNGVTNGSHNALVTAPKSKSKSTPKSSSLSLLVPSAETAFGIGTDGSIDQRITDTYDAWLRRQAIEGPQQIPANAVRRLEAYVQSGRLTIDQHWPALKALAQANPTTPPAELAALYRKPKP